MRITLNLYIYGLTVKHTISGIINCTQSCITDIKSTERLMAIMIHIGNVYYKTEVQTATSQLAVI